MMMIMHNRLAWSCWLVHLTTWPPRSWPWFSFCTAWPAAFCLLRYKCGSRSSPSSCWVSAWRPWSLAPAPTSWSTWSSVSSYRRRIGRYNHVRNTLQSWLHVSSRGKIVNEWKHLSLKWGKTWLKSLHIVHLIWIHHSIKSHRNLPIISILQFVHTLAKQYDTNPPEGGEALSLTDKSSPCLCVQPSSSADCRWWSTTCCWRWPALSSTQRSCTLRSATSWSTE